MMKLTGKLLCGWLALELAVLPLAMPAFAGLSHRVSFSVKPQVHATQLSAPAGTTRFLIASNAPFAVVSQGAMTELSVTVSQQGDILGSPYGSKAQMPGPETACNIPNSLRASRIYTSQNKTAASRGSKLEQSVLVEVTYDPALEPKISLVSMESLRKENSALLAIPCALTLS